ncbi:MAG: pyridoxal-dependent decarboxylase [Gemmatimonadota bacterium]
MGPTEAAAPELAAVSEPEFAGPAQRETLDPQDWEGFRTLAHRTLDRMIDLQRDIRDEPVWRQVPDDVERRFQEAAPVDGAPIEEVLRDVAQLVVPYPTGNLHPRFWGWVGGTGSPTGMLGDLIAAGTNSVAGNFNDAAARVEEQVTRWMADAIGMPTGTTGLITSGGSVANLVGLAAARDAVAGFDVPGRGVRAAPGQLALYASTEVHSSVTKAAQLLGIGRDGLRLIPTDAQYRIDTNLLSRTMREDRADGFVPIGIVGNAGTVNTGAIDDLDRLADIARDESVWLHVDGAFGAVAALSDNLRPLLRGLERADSVALDFHKWMYVPYEAGAVLVRDADALKRPFASDAAYLAPPPRGVGAQPDPANGRGPQLSRGFKALKVWMLIKEQGLAKYGRLVEQNVRDVRHLAALIDSHPDLDRVAPAPLNVVCFRYAPRGAAPDAPLDEWNQEILMRLQERGIAVPSSTVLRGHFVLRVANVNHRTRAEDFDLLVRETLRIGRELSG